MKPLAAEKPGQKVETFARTRFVRNVMRKTARRWRRVDAKQGRNWLKDQLKKEVCDE
jgi:hypothetical protein